MDGLLGHGHYQPWHVGDSVKRDCSWPQLAGCNPYHGRRYILRSCTDGPVSNHTSKTILHQTLTGGSNGAIGARLHIPFAVAIRSSFGYYFAYVGMPTLA